LDGLIKHSNLLCIDFDNIKDLDWLREKLLEDEYFETQLIFKSPSGNGLKWLISIDIEEYDHLTWFNSIEVYIDKMYGIKIDKSGKDVCRSCFLCHDKDAYINEKF